MMQEWADYLDRLREGELAKNRAFTSSLEGRKHHDSVVTG
jgi:hypothetical protein